jgi:drug/metabolite transporter (DMT)-like permease
MVGGLYFVFVERAGDVHGLWALLSARITSTLLTGIALVFLWRRLRFAQSRPLAPALWPALSSGGLDALGSLLYVFAIRRELLSVTATLVSLYTGVTVLLAWIVLGERFRARHAAGMAFAALAIVLIVAGR